MKGQKLPNNKNKDITIRDLDNGIRIATKMLKLLSNGAKN